VILLASLFGGWLPSLMRLTHTRMQVMMSLVGGLMLGVAVLHLLPHAVVATNSLDWACGFAVAGLLTMFFLIRIFHVHGHEPHADPGQQETCQHPAHDHPPEEPGTVAHAHSLNWIGLFVGLALHTLIDGIALAASVVAGVHDAANVGLVGLGTFLAVVLHKPLDALAITTVMMRGRWSPLWRRTVNCLFALMCPLGALLFYFGVRTQSGATDLGVGCALGFAAGAFLCISLADLLPEVQFHRHDRWKLSAALLFGVLLAWLIGFAEPSHEHAPQHPTAPQHDHSDAEEHPHAHG
jgi:zinc and cadmium transporter